jgi:hypothetical protein
MIQPKFIVNDKVKLSDLYFTEGRKLFGKKLKYFNGYRKILKVYPGSITQLQECPPFYILSGSKEPTFLAQQFLTK